LASANGRPLSTDFSGSAAAITKPRSIFGDCLAYAAASGANDSLLFVGGDFALTDITPA
jgi:uncharacterized protein with PIN domain